MDDVDAMTAGLETIEERTAFIIKAELAMAKFEPMLWAEPSKAVATSISAKSTVTAKRCAVGAFVF